MSWGSFPNGSIPVIRRIPGNKAELLADFVYIDKDDNRHMARKGMIYDGASRPLLDPWHDDIIGPATIHDQYCQDGKIGQSPYPSTHVHRLFYEANKCNGVSEWRARIRYLAVYNLGPKFPANGSF